MTDTPQQTTVRLWPLVDGGYDVTVDELPCTAVGVDRHDALLNIAEQIERTLGGSEEEAARQLHDETQRVHRVADQCTRLIVCTTLVAERQFPSGWQHLIRQLYESLGRMIDGMAGEPPSSRYRVAVLYQDRQSFAPPSRIWMEEIVVARNAQEAIDVIMGSHADDPEVNKAVAACVIGWSAE